MSGVRTNQKEQNTRPVAKSCLAWGAAGVESVMRAEQHMGKVLQMTIVMTLAFILMENEIHCIVLSRGHDLICILKDGSQYGFKNILSGVRVETDQLANIFHNLGRR